MAEQLTHDGQPFVMNRTYWRLRPHISEPHEVVEWQINDLEVYSVNNALIDRRDNSLFVCCISDLFTTKRAALEALLKHKLHYVKYRQLADKEALRRIRQEISGVKPGCDHVAG